MEVQRQDLYGAWQLARYDLTAADADAFVQQTAPAAVGRAAQYAILVNDKDLAFGALGTVDEGYLACGQLQLLSGRLPGTAGEAALTTSVLDSIGASYEPVSYTHLPEPPVPLLRAERREWLREHPQHPARSTEKEDRRPRRRPDVYKRQV